MAKVSKKTTKKTKAKPKAKAKPKTKTTKKPVSNAKKQVKTKAKAKTTAKSKVSVKKKSSARTKHVEVISPTKKLKKIQGYSKKDMEDFRAGINEKRNEIIEQLQALKDQMMDQTTGQYVNENSPYSLHMAEQGTDAMEREKLYLWAQRENKFLGYLDDALQRIENGTYGICIECIDEPQGLCPTCPLVPKERLMAVPHTQHCLQVKQKMKSK